MCLTMFYATGGHAKARPYRRIPNVKLKNNRLFGIDLSLRYQHLPETNRKYDCASFLILTNIRGIEAEKACNFS